MKVKQAILMWVIGAATLVAAWLVCGVVIATSVLLISTQLIDLSNAAFLPALVPLLSICLAVLTAAGVMIRFWRTTKETVQPTSAGDVLKAAPEK